jgi:LuxR family maltose regulon positive regulatory protein
MPSAHACRDDGQREPSRHRGEQHGASSALLDDVVWRSSDLQTYLSGEFMARLSAELAEFAEALPISRRLNAFSSRDSSRATRMRTELFRRIRDGNLLQIRVDLDDRLTWFSLHPLFRYLPRPRGPKCR